MRYQIRHAIVKYAADTILEDVNFEIHDHEKIAIIGRNGCGKTTLLKLISGEVEMANPDSDEECGIVMAGKQRQPRPPAVRDVRRGSDAGLR